MATASLANRTESIVVTTDPEFSDLYRRYAASVYRTALRVAGRPADAEDIVQSVFLRLLDRRIAVDPGGSPEGYLRRAATNAAIDLLRRRALLPEAGTPEDQLESARENPVLLKERLRRALAKLPPSDAELFVLCYLEGYSYDELAQLFEIERGTVASRLHRTRALLRKDLSK
jgi:RNA polymerase sigma-70 factor (ECF subfamily)